MDYFYISCFFLIILSAFFSGCETSMYSVSRVKLRYRLDSMTTKSVKKNDRRARALNWAINPIAPSIICILIGNNIAAQLLATITEDYFHTFGAWSVVLTTAVLTPIVLIFAEFLPKHFSRIYSNRLSYDAIYILIFFRIVLLPAILIANLIAKTLQAITRTGGDALWEPHTSQNNLRSFLKAETSGHNMTHIQKQLIDRVMALDRINVTYDKVSKPISTLATIGLHLDARAAIAHIGPTYYTRYLIIDSRNQKPVGYISAATLVCAEDHQSIADLLQLLPEISEDTAVHTALQQLNATGSDMGLIFNSKNIPTRILFRGDCVKVLANM